MESQQQFSILRGQQKPRKVQLLHRIFEEKVDQGCGNRTAIIFNEKKLNYNTLNSNANRLSAALLQRIRNGKMKANGNADWAIVVCMAPSDYLITTLLAIWKCGAAYVPIDPSFPSNRITHILEETQPVFVLHDAKVDVEKFGNNSVVSFDVLEEEAKKLSNANIREDATLNSCTTDPIAVILYTSGSTGMPKGVRLPYSVITNRLFWQWEKFPYSPSENIGAFKTALTFVDHIPELWGPLLNEMTVLCIPRDCTKNPEKLVNLLEHYKVERLILVPSLLKAILMFLQQQTSFKPLPSLKIWISSGETLSMPLAREFFDYFKQSHILCNFYGSTEIMDASYFICDTLKSLEFWKCIPIGYPWDNTDLYVLDGDMQPVIRGEIGELYVSGMNLARGYVNDNEGFIDNPLDPKFPRLYRTGDFARIHNSALIFEGRRDTLVKIRGHRVNLNEIERNLLKMPEVEKSTVLCYRTEQCNQTIVAFTVLTKNSQENVLQSKLLNILPDYMIPELFIINKFPLLVNGKVDRQLLLQQYAQNNINIDYSGIEEDHLHVATDLFEIIGSVIGRSKGTVSLQGNFFELGGNSLNTVLAVTKLRTKGYKIGITDFIEAKNLGDILQIITQKTTRSNDKNVSLKLTAIPFNSSHKEDVIEIISTSFYDKGTLARYLKPHILPTDYPNYIRAIWDFSLEKNLSFVVVNEDNLIMGAVINMDPRDEPKVNKLTKNMEIILEFLKQNVRRIIDNMPPEKNIVFYSSMMGTNTKLSSKENVKVIQFMEQENLRLAKEKKFAGALAVNSSPLTQQLGTIMGYKELFTFKINQYVYKDGSLPFDKAPDTEKVIIHWKQICFDKN